MPLIDIKPTSSPTAQSESDPPVGTGGEETSTSQADVGIKPPTATEPADPSVGGGSADSSGIGE
jgi:hypothetical protein